MPPMNARLMKFVIGFALIGGIGIPAFFIALWALTIAVLKGNADALYEAWAWYEAFRVMLWPSSLFIVARATGDVAGEIQDLLIAVLSNIGVYALVGGATALACTNRIAEVALVIIVLTLVCSVNAFWSSHLPSFFITAAVVAIVFIALFRRYGKTSNASPRA